MNESRSLTTLESVRFGEFLRDRKLINDEQWLAALADHWSAPRHRRIGATIVERGLLSAEQVEDAARAFHDDLQVIEVEAELDAEIEPDQAAAADPDPPAEPITSPMERVGLG